MKLNVSLKFSSEKVIKVGVLYQKGRDCAFEYDSFFLSRGLNPSPFRLPVKSGVNIFDWSGTADALKPDPCKVGEAKEDQKVE